MRLLIHAVTQMKKKLFRFLTNRDEVRLTLNQSKAQEATQQKTGSVFCILDFGIGGESLDWNLNGRYFCLTCL